MPGIAKLVLIGGAAAMLLATNAAAANRPIKSPRAETVKVKTVVAKRANLMAEMNGPYHVAAAARWNPRPVITQWPMPNTVWW